MIGNSLLPSDVTTAGPYAGMFGSLRFGAEHGVVPMAQELQAALAARSAPLKIIDMAAGGDIDSEVFRWIEKMDAFIVFGSAKYGEDTGNQACTYYEYKHAFALKKRIILIRMIPFDQEFEELQARVIFNANKLVIPWMLGTPMPPDLPDKILEAIGLRSTVEQRLAQLEAENAELRSSVQGLEQKITTLERVVNPVSVSREELLSMRPRQLKAKATELGVSPALIDEAEDADDVKGFLQQLILSHVGESAASAAAAAPEGGQQGASGPKVAALEAQVASILQKLQQLEAAQQTAPAPAPEATLAPAMVQPPVPDPTPFNNRTLEMGLDDADREILRDNELFEVDDLAVMGSDDYHAIGIHVEEKRHALQLKQAMQGVRMSSTDIDTIFTQAHSRERYPSTAAALLHVTCSVCGSLQISVLVFMNLACGLQ